MKMGKFFKLIGLIMLIVVFAVACSGGGQAGNDGENASGDAANESEDNGGNTNGAEFTLVAGHGTAIDTTFDKALLKFKELVEEKTDGRVEVTVHPAAELGAEPDMFQSLVQGTQDVMITAPGSLGDFVPELSLFDLAFVIKDAEHQQKVVNGEVGEALAQIMEEKTGVVTMGYGGGAARNMYFTEPASSLEDIQGRKFRALPTAHPFFNALGLDTTYIAHPEIYTGLQQGVIDGGENEPFFTISEGFAEAAPNLLLTAHDVTVRPLLISPHTLEKLPDDLEAAVMEAGKEAAQYEHELELEEEQKAIEQMKADGVNVVEVKDKAPYIEKVKPVWEEWAKENGVEDLLQKIIELGEN